MSCGELKELPFQSTNVNLTWENPTCAYLLNPYLLISEPSNPRYFKPSMSENELCTLPLKSVPPFVKEHHHSQPRT